MEEYEIVTRRKVTPGQMKRMQAILDETEPVPSLPEREDWGADNLFFKNQPGLILENFRLQGRIIVEGCPDVIVRNFDLFGTHENEWGNLTLRNSPRALVEDGESHDNPRGHGLFLDGDMDGTIVRRFKAWGNQEDGIQANNDATGNILFEDILTHGNGENDLDWKAAAKGTFRRFQFMGWSKAKHESVTLQNHHVATEFHDGIIAVKNENGVLNLSTGGALFAGTAFYVPHDLWWNLDDNPRYGPLLDGTLMGLTCHACTRLAADPFPEPI